MPTPVSTARQCLTHDAALALDDAVSVARRRSHAQTTSLHAISSLLTLPSSPLRDACTRARNTAYTSRIQFKALELCLAVNLDRLPSSPNRVDHPPVSNSLMAAIKRSQANQRRQPENFHFYHQQQQTISSSSNSVSTVRVELQNMLLSILDDPVVSRVFGDAGFRSCDIKLAILRPAHQLLRYRGPPMFLCNLAPGRQPGLSLPFFGGCRILDNDENFKKIGQVVGRKKGARRNPVLVGVGAKDVLKDFLEMVRKGGGPLDLCGGLTSVICMEIEVSKYVDGSHDLLKSRFEEVGRVVKKSIGGVVINFGDLKFLVDENSSVEVASYAVKEVASLVEEFCHDDGKLWVIGATARHESYLELLNKFPCIEKDWDLQFLPLSTPTPPDTYHPRSSLMESFVPFGGLFSSPSDMKRSPFSSTNQYATRCHVCNEKYKQEVSSLAEGGFTTSVADQSGLPSWSQMTELSKNKDMDAAKAKDSSAVLSTTVEKKWDSICQRLHQAQPYVKMSPKAAYKPGTQVPSIVGFQVVEGRKESFDPSINIKNASSAESGCADMKSFRSMDLRHYPPAEAITQLPSKLAEKPSKIEELGVRSSLSSSSYGADRASQMSADSVTTDLGLGVNSATLSRELEERTPEAHVKSSSTSFPVLGQCDQKDFKMLYMALYARIGRQEEAIRVVSQTIARCRTRNARRPGSRGDIWFFFVGPDKIAKKKVVVSLAETLCGKRENLICVDLSWQDSVDSTNIMISCQQMKGYDVKFRGKTVVDYITEELGKKPWSVVFLENVDKADVLAQSHLSRALKTGRFSDSHGREVSISNAIFVASSSISTEGSKIISPEKEYVGYSEEDILSWKGCPIQMLIGFDLGDVLDGKTNASPVIMNKRKLVGQSETLRQGQSLETAKRAHKALNVFLDLNLPAEESETADTDHDNITGNLKAWLEDFFGRVDQTVVFKPFDFNGLAKKLVKEIGECFRRTIGTVGLLEIDSKVIEQMVAAECLLEKNSVQDWIDGVLGSAFVEAQKRYTLSSRTVVKLVKCEGLYPEEQLQGMFLPARIVMN